MHPMPRRLTVSLLALALLALAAGCGHRGPLVPPEESAVSVTHPAAA
jgi:predicted small lipoprotein YifL